MGRMSDLWIERHNQELDRMNASAPTAQAETFDLQAALANMTTEQLAATYAAIQAIAAQFASQPAAQTGRTGAARNER